MTGGLIRRLTDTVSPYLATGTAVQVVVQLSQEPDDEWGRRFRASAPAGFWMKLAMSYGQIPGLWLDRGRVQFVCRAHEVRENMAELERRIVYANARGLAQRPSSPGPAGND